MLAIHWDQQSFVSGGDGTWGMIWRVIGAVGAGIIKWLTLEFLGNLGAVPSCCFAVICHGLTLDTSGGNRDVWTLVGVQIGRVPDAVKDIVVVCTLGGGEPRGVGDTLEDSVSSWWGCEGGASGMWKAGSLLSLWDASVNTSERSFKAWIMKTCRCWGMEVLSALVRFSAAAMTMSFWVTDGLDNYLCLKNVVPKIRVARVAIDQNYQHW